MKKETLKYQQCAKELFCHSKNSFNLQLKVRNKIHELCYSAAPTTMSKDFRISDMLVPDLDPCPVLYDCTASLYVELTIKVSDVINILDKRADGRWLRELAGQVGIFPASNVEVESDA